MVVETGVGGSSLLAKKAGTVASTTRMLKAASSLVVQSFPDPGILAISPE
jgi:hypothetical protein